MKHVLVLDSDQTIVMSVADFLGQHAIRTTPVAESRQLRRILSTEIVDALLIEVNSQDGIDVVRSMASITAAPILIISGERTAEDHKVEGLEAGASDYICSPFGKRELLARLNVAMRDRPIVERDRRSYSFSGSELFVQQKALRRPGLDEVKLTTAEFNLLTAFLGAPRQILSRERLLAASRIHSGEIFDRSLDALILRLRRKIERDPAKPNLIKTVRGSGYLFDSDVLYDDRPRLKR
jgi:DNA-binding response OmpR family regulator